jgi:hypothetical protein
MNAWERDSEPELFSVTPSISRSFFNFAQGYTAIQTIEAIDAPMIIEGISMNPTVLQRSDGLHVP